MAMTTQCPSCATQFRIQTDQLIARQGKVRCGQCRHVFDALKGLVHAKAENSVTSGNVGNHAPKLTSTQSMPTLAQAPNNFAAVDEPSTRTLPLDSVDARLLEVEPITTSPILERPPPAPPQPISAAARAYLAQDSASPTTHPAEAPVTPVTPNPPMNEVEQAFVDALVQGDANQAAVSVDAATEPPPKFLKEPRQKRVLGPLAKTVYGLLTLVAAALLAAQTAYAFRERIAADVPESKPYLAQLCDLVATLPTQPWPPCKTPKPVRDATLIAIDFHELSSDSKAVLVLSALLRNKAAYAQPLPMLEVALVDGAKQVITRRALTPAEYLDPAQGPIAAIKQIEANAELQAKILIRAQDLNAATYNLQVFYPD